MYFQINSKNHGVAQFWMPDNGGYIRLESSNNPGTLGKQICSGGGFAGNTLSATPASFEAVCRKWHRQHLAAIREFGLDYGK